MKPIYPPLWLEHMLQRALPTRNRESIAGDLLEAYTDHRQRRGALSANLWYARQLLSFGPAASLRAAPLEPLLILMCSFTALAGCWLGAMDVLLRHPDIAGHEAIAGTIVLQGMLTLACLRFRRATALLWAVLAGCIAIVALAAVAFHGLLTSPDFEGYIFLIGLALLIQAILTMLTLYRRQCTPEPQRRLQ